MQNFEQKLKQERMTNSVETADAIKKENFTEKKPESHEDLTNRLKSNLEQSKSLKEKISSDTDHLNKIRSALGLGHQTEDTVSIAKNKEKLASLSNEYQEIHNTILNDNTYSTDNLEGIFQNEKVNGENIATKGNLLWEKQSRNMQTSFEKSKAETNQKSRDLAARIHGGGMEMSDEEWNKKVAQEKTESEQNLANIKKGLDEWDNTMKEKAEREQRSHEQFEKDFASGKVHEDMNKIFDNLEKETNPKAYRDRIERNLTDTLSSSDFKEFQKTVPEYTDKYLNVLDGDLVNYDGVKFSSIQEKREKQKELVEKYQAWRKNTYNSFP